MEASFFFVTMIAFTYVYTRIYVMLKRIYGIAWKRVIRLNAYPIMYSTYKIKESCLYCKIHVAFWRGNILVIEVYVCNLRTVHSDESL